MTSLQRAAAYLKKAGPKAALAIVPLAMAVPSHADILFNYVGGSWDVQTTGTVVLSPVSEAISGVPLTGSLLQGFDLAGSKIFSWDSGGTITATATWSGNGTGTNQVFPASTIQGFYNFSFEATSPLTIAWSVLFNINGTESFFANQVIGSSGDVNASNVDIDVPLGGTLTNWSTTLTLSWAAAGGTENISIDIPNPDGIGIYTQDLAEVPEPATALLATPFLAGLMLVRRRLRRR